MAEDNFSYIVGPGSREQDRKQEKIIYFQRQLTTSCLALSPKFLELSPNNAATQVLSIQNHEPTHVGGKSIAYLNEGNS